MIEKFTAEELEIIKRELGIAKTAGSKKAICSKQNKRIADMFPASCDFSQHGMRPREDIWNAVTVLCDYATNNINRSYAGANRNSTNNRNKNWARYSSIFNKEQYLAMADEILDLFEKYRNMSAGDD